MNKRKVNLNKLRGSELLQKAVKKLKGKILFPQKVEAARQFLEKVNYTALSEKCQ